MAERLSLDHAHLELRRIGGADSALKILKGACSGGLRDGAIIAHSTALVLASCAQDGAIAAEIGAAASWSAVVAPVFAQDEGTASSVDEKTRALVQRLLGDTITAVASVPAAASPLRSSLTTAHNAGRPPLAALAAGLRRQLDALCEAPASPDAAYRAEACTQVFAGLGSLAATDALEPVAGQGTESPFARACLQERAVDAALTAAQLCWAAEEEGVGNGGAAASDDDAAQARLSALEAATCHCLADIALASQPSASHVLAWDGVPTLLSRYAGVQRRPAAAAAALARLVAALWGTSLAEAAEAFRGETAAVLDATAGCMASEEAALQEAGCAMVTNLVLQVADREALRASAACRAFHQRLLQGSECLLPLAWLLDSRADAVQRRAAQVFAHMRRKRDNDLMVSLVEQGAVPAIHALARESTRKASPGRDAARDAFGYIKDELRGAFLSLLLRSLDMEGNYTRRANIAVAFIHVSSSSRDVCLEFAGTESPSSALFAVAGMAVDEGEAGRAAAVPCFRALLPLARSLAPRAPAGAGSALDAIDAEAAQHEDLFNNKTSSDFTLVVGPDATPLHAHTAVLRAASPGLAAIVDRAQKEGLSSIRIAEEDRSQAMLLLLRFVYRPSWAKLEEYAAAEDIALAENLPPLLQIASDLQHGSLVEAVAESLRQGVSAAAAGDRGPPLAATLDAAAAAERFDLVEAIYAELAEGEAALGQLAQAPTGKGSPGPAAAVAHSMFAVLAALHTGVEGAA